MTLNRRTFLGTTAAAAASLSAPLVMAGAHGKPRVVVVGGGAGGATAARYLAKDSKVSLTLSWLNQHELIIPASFRTSILVGLNRSLI